MTERLLTMLEDILCALSWAFAVLERRVHAWRMNRRAIAEPAKPRYQCSFCYTGIPQSDYGDSYGIYCSDHCLLLADRLRRERSSLAGRADAADVLAGVQGHDGWIGGHYVAPPMGTAPTVTGAWSLAEVGGVEPGQKP